MIGVNLEAIYRLPVTQRTSQYNVYFGAGTALNFLHQNFERKEGAAINIDFGNVEYKTGFNILMGMRADAAPHNRGSRWSSRRVYCVAAVPEFAPVGEEQGDGSVPDCAALLRDSAAAEPPAEAFDRM